LSDVSSLTEAGGVDADDVHRILCGRRTVHDFQSERVPEEMIVKAIEAARWAPNHHRTEPWHFYLLGEKSRARIAELNAELVRDSKGERAAEIKLKRWNAMPGWLVLTCVHSDEPVRSREDYAACCCAAQNLMLYLWAEGVGVKWTTGRVTTLDDFYAAAGIAREREYVVGLFWYGWPATVITQHRKAIDELIDRID
jgi:nitroreductase